MTTLGKDTLAISMPLGMGRELTETLRNLELTPSEAGRLFFGWVVLHKRLPFEVNFKRTANTRESLASALTHDADD